jgi:hypothetical protein
MPSTNSPNSNNFAILNFCSILKIGLPNASSIKQTTSSGFDFLMQIKWLINEA